MDEANYECSEFGEFCSIVNNELVFGSFFAFTFFEEGKKRIVYSSNKINPTEIIFAWDWSDPWSIYYAEKSMLSSLKNE